MIINNQMEKEVVKRKEKYSVIKNILFCIKFAMEQQSGFIISLIVAGFCWGAYPLIFSYLPKIIIDMIQKKTNVGLLILLMFIVTVTLVIIGLIDDRVNKSFDWKSLKVKMAFIQKRMEKSFRMDYKNLENPEVLNLMERARYATDGNHDGVNGIYHNIVCIARNLLTIVVTISAIVVVDPLIIIIICILSFLTT